MVRTRCFYCWDLGSIPGQGTKIPQAAMAKKVVKQRCAFPFDMLSTLMVCVMTSSLTYTLKMTKTECDSSWLWDQ